MSSSSNPELGYFPLVRVGKSCLSLRTIASSEAVRRFRGLPLESCFDVLSTAYLRTLIGKMARAGYPGASTLVTNFRSRQNWRGAGYPIPYTSGIFICEDTRLRAAHPDGTIDTLHLGGILSLNTLGGPILQRQNTETIKYTRATAFEALQQFATRAASNPRETPLLSDQMDFLTGTTGQQYL